LRFARDFKRISQQLEDAIEQGKNSTDDFEEDYAGVAADFQAYINQQQGTVSMGLLKRLWNDLAKTPEAARRPERRRWDG